MQQNLPKKLPPRTIKLDEDFSLTWDKYQWILLDNQITSDSGKRPVNPRKSFHGTMAQTLSHMLEHQLGSESLDIQGLLDKLDTLATQMKACAEGLAESLNKE